MLHSNAQIAIIKFAFTTDIKPYQKWKRYNTTFANIAHGSSLFDPTASWVTDSAKQQQNSQRIHHSQVQDKRQIRRGIEPQYHLVGIFDFWAYGLEGRGDRDGDRWIKNGNIIIAGPIDRIGETGLLPYRRRVLWNNAADLIITQLFHKFCERQSQALWFCLQEREHSWWGLQEDSIVGASKGDS